MLINLNLKKLLGYSVILTCFTKSLEVIFIYSGVGIDIYAYSLMPVLFVLLICMPSHFSEKNAYLIIGFILVFVSIGILIKVYYGYSLFPFFKQFIPIVIFYFVFAATLRKTGFQYLFDIYLKIAYLCACFGLVQYFLSYLNINIFVNVQGRLNSILPEASHYAAVVMPAFIYYIFTSTSLREKYVFSLSMLLTFSSTAFLVIALVLFLRFAKGVYAVAFIPLLMVVAYTAYTEVEILNSRLSDVFLFLEHGDILNANATTFSFMSNFLPAISNVSEFRFFGIGLGGHTELYDNYYSSSYDISNYRLYGLNSGSGHSLFIRLLSEFGLMSIVIFMALTVMSLNVFFERDIYRKVILLALLSGIYVRFFKFGGYFDYGLPFFVTSLIFVYYKFDATITKKQIGI